MKFLDRLEAGERARLLDAADTIRLSRGETLIHRGEPGGDVYLLETGTLEVLDTRSDPAIILDTVAAGSLVGEMGFLSETTRTADVRAAEDCLCHHWPRGRLTQLIAHDAELGRSLYRVLAELVVERSRSISRLAEQGALGHAPPPRATAAAVRHLADPLRDVLMAAEPDFRRDPLAAEQRVRDALDRMRGELFEAWQARNLHDRRALGASLGRELHPYLIRSHLAEYALDRASGASEDPLALEHLYRDEAGGDGELGELIDRWLLALPTARALRQRSAVVSDICAELVGAGHQVVTINASRWPGLPDLAARLTQAGGTLTLIENERGALRAAQRQAAQLPADRIQLVHLPIAGALMTGQAPDIGGQDLVIVWGLLDYLPDRLAARLLRAVGRGLSPGGRAIVTGLAHADDAPIFDHLLGWPLVRRTARTLLDLSSRAGLDCDVAPGANGAALVATGRLITPTPPRPTQGTVG